MKISRRTWLAAAVALPGFPQNLAAGKFLLATRRSQDPDFARSIVLLIYTGREGYLGLMMNRPWDVPVSQLFPDLKQSKAKLYEGGPIAAGVRALLRSRSKPEQGEPVLRDVYLISQVKLIEKLLAAGTPASVFRVYAGSVGWSPQQLKDEVARGLWRLLPGEPAAVFDPNPQTLWSRLSK